MNKNQKQIICILAISFVIGIIITAVGNKINNDDVLVPGMMITIFSLVGLIIWGRKKPAKTQKQKATIQSTPASKEDKAKQGRKESFEYQMRLAKAMNMDYIECSSSLNPCPKCAPYRYRIYSISGKDKRFPKFSEHITAPEEMCCLNFYGKHYFNKDKITTYQFPKTGGIKEKNVDAIKSSNRPFIYDVSEAEILYVKPQKKTK